MKFIKNLAFQLTLLPLALSATLQCHPLATAKKGGRELHSSQFHDLHEAEALEAHAGRKGPLRNERHVQPKAEKLKKNHAEPQRIIPGAAVVPSAPAQRDRLHPEALIQQRGRQLPRRTRPGGADTQIDRSNESVHRVDKHHGRQHLIPGSALHAPHVPVKELPRESTRTSPSRHVIPGISHYDHAPVVTINPYPPEVVIVPEESAYPVIALTPFAISENGHLIELNDGSHWRVCRCHRSLTKYWHRGEAIFIEKGGPFLWPHYRLINYSRGEAVDVKLDQPQFGLQLSAHFQSLIP